MQDKINQSDLFVDFLKERSFISVHGIEKALEMTTGNISKAIAGKRPIPEKYWYNLYLLLIPYGFQYPEIEEEIEYPYHVFDILELSVSRTETGFFVQDTITLEGWGISDFDMSGVLRSFL